MSTWPARLKEYWTRNVFLVGCLLLPWLFVSLLPLALAHVSTPVTILGWPLPFALTAFGLPLIYLLIIGCYAVVMARRDAALMRDLSAAPDFTFAQDPSQNPSQNE